MIELKILWDDQQGHVTVNGPIDNKGLCYLILECARDAIKDHYDTVTKNKIVTPLRNGLRKFKRG